MAALGGLLIFPVLAHAGDAPRKRLNRNDVASKPRTSPLDREFGAMAAFGTGVRKAYGAWITLRRENFFGSVDCGTLRVTVSVPVAGVSFSTVTSPALVASTV